MSESTLKFIEDCRSTEDFPYMSKQLSLFNSLCIVLDKDWKDVFRQYLKIATWLGVMPNDRKCINAIMKKYGFVNKKNKGCFESLSDMADFAAKTCSNREPVILRLNCGQTVAAVYDYSAGRYTVRGHHEPDTLYVSEYWIKTREEDMISYCVIYRGCGDVIDPKRERSSDFPLELYQPNPCRNRIGDCVIRAISAVLGIPWSEVIFRIAEDSGYTNTTLNTPTVFECTLKASGFVRHTAPRISNRFMKGGEFCDYLTSHCKNGEPVFASMGRSHVVGILPFSVGGKLQYKIADSWNSTDRTVTEYWVKPAPAVSKKIVYRTYAVGEKVYHPTFGTGNIIRVQGEKQNCRLTINFSNGGTKVLSAAWVSEKCTECA